MILTVFGMSTNEQVTKNIHTKICLRKIPSCLQNNEFFDSFSKTEGYVEMQWTPISHSNKSFTCCNKNFFEGYIQYDNYSNAARMLQFVNSMKFMCSEIPGRVHDICGMISLNQRYIKCPILCDQLEDGKIPILGSPIETDEEFLKFQKVMQKPHINLSEAETYMKSLTSTSIKNDDVEKTNNIHIIVPKRMNKSNKVSSNNHYKNKSSRLNRERKSTKNNC